MIIFSFIQEHKKVLKWYFSQTHNKFFTKNAFLIIPKNFSFILVFSIIYKENSTFLEFFHKLYSLTFNS